MRVLMIPFLLLFTVNPSAGSDLQTWLASDARGELVSTFESSNCRLTLTEVSDILFDYDWVDEFVYMERLIQMEPEAEPLTFPVVLIKGDVCTDVTIVPIVLPESALEFALAELDRHACWLDIGKLESLKYPDELDAQLSDSDRRNVVSELYNRGWVTFRYDTENGVDKLHVYSMADSCK